MSLFSSPIIRSGMRILTNAGIFILTFSFTFVTVGIALFTRNQLNMSNGLSAYWIGITRIISRVVLAVLPVGRADINQGPWPGFNPITKMLHTVFEPNYNCPINLNPNIFERALNSAVTIFGSVPASRALLLFVFIHPLICLVIAAFVRHQPQYQLYRYHGMPNNKMVGKSFPNLAKIIMFSAVLSVIWPVASKIIWHTWWEYYGLVSQRYTVILTHDQNGISAGGGVNPYGSGVARGWFGYYGVVAGVFLSYLLTVWWSAKFVINRSVKREAVAAGVEGSGDRVVVEGDEGRDDVGVGENRLLTAGHRGRRWMWRIGIGLFILMLYGWPLVVGWVGRVLPDDIWMKWVPY